MGQLAVSIGGAALGFAIGGPFGAATLGAQLGFVAGSLLGAVLFPPDPIINEGARLKDLSVTASTYGRPIPKVYGAARVGGNIVWSPGLIETKIEEEVGGKGGPSVTNVTYKYSAHWRIILAAGTAQSVPRIWMDGKLKFDQTGTGVLADNGTTWFDGSAWSIIPELVSLKFTTNDSAIIFYSGDESQVADPAEEADLGVGNVPAYRGVVSLVFINYPLEDFGNRIPQVNAEVVQSSTDTFPEQQVTEVVPTAGNPLFLHSPNQEFVIIWSKAGTELRCFSFRAQQYLWTWSPPSGTLGYADATNDRVFIGNGTTLWVFDILTGEVLDSFSNVITNDGFGQAKIIYTVKGSGLYANEYVISLAYFGHLNVFHLGSPATSGFVPNLRYSRNLNAFLSLGNDTSYQTLNRDSGGDIWYTTNPVGSGPSKLIRVEPEIITGTESINVEIVENPLDVSVITDIVDLMSYVPETNSFFMSNADEDVWHEYSLDTRAFTGNSMSYGTLSQGDATYFHARNGSINGQIWFHTGNQVLYDFAGWSGQVRSIDGSDWPTPTAGQSQGVYDPINHGFLITESNPDTLIFIDRVDVGSTTLQAIVEDVADQAGYTIANDIDATALTDVVQGYVIAGRQPASGPIEALSPLYDFNAREEDFKIEFVKGGGASAFTIDEDDLGVANSNLGNEVKLQRERIDERDIPRIVEINFNDQEFDYQSGTQRWQRIQEATTSERKLVFSVGLAETNTNVLAMAENIGQKSWLERFNYSTTLGPKHYRISPGDIGTISIDGQSLLVKVLTANLGDNGVYEIQAVSENLEGHTSAGNTGTGSGDFPNQTVGGTALVTLYVIDNPILLDSQDGIGTMVAGGRIGTGNFPGESVFYSIDNVNYAVIDAIASSQEVTHGKTNEALLSAKPTVWDRTNTLTVEMFNGTLASATEAEVLNGANFCLVGDEYMQFANATLNGDGTYTLDTLLRGRKGTEWAISNHQESERFVVMTTTTIFNHNVSDSLINSTVFYKGVAFQQGFETGTTRQLTYEANAKKPYAVSHIKATFQGSPQDIDITWVRRTRLSGEWADASATVALGEESEEYEIEILDAGSPDLVLRTITGLTSPSYTYNEADQITDFGSPVTSVTVRVYQISATVGRGFPSTQLLSA